MRCPTPAAGYMGRCPVPGALTVLYVAHVLRGTPRDVRNARAAAVPPILRSWATTAQYAAVTWGLSAAKVTPSRLASASCVVAVQ